MVEIKTQIEPIVFTEIWHKLSGPLPVVRSVEEVIEVFQSQAAPYTQEFVPRLASDILNVTSENEFPKRAKTQIKFLANSLAGRPTVKASPSRDICAKGRAEEKARWPHKILRKEFYVECSRGFKGPTLNNACRKCGAQISLHA